MTRLGHPHVGTASARGRDRPPLGGAERAKSKFQRCQLTFVQASSASAICLKRGGVESVPPELIGPKRRPLARQRAPNRTTAPTRNANALGNLRPPEALILSADATTIAAWASTLADGTYV